MRLLAVLAAAVLLPSCGLRRQLALMKDPLTVGERAALARAYEADGLLEDAEREHRRVLRRDKRNAGARAFLGARAFEAGDVRGAIRHFEIARKRAPENPALMNNLAMALAAEGRRLRAAERLARGALADAGVRPYAYDTLALIYMKSGRPEQAREALRSARRHAPPGNAAFLAKLAETEQRLGPESGAGP